MSGGDAHSLPMEDRLYVCTDTCNHVGIRSAIRQRFTSDVNIFVRSPCYTERKINTGISDVELNTKLTRIGFKLIIIIEA